MSMFNRFSLFAGAVLIAVAVYAPGLNWSGDDAADPGGGLAGLTEIARSSGASAPSPTTISGGQYVLNRQSDGHFYADGRIKGANVKFLVDTGASVVALTERDARAAGIVWHPRDIRPIGTGASGPVHGVTTELDTLEVNGITARNVRAVVIPEGLTVSLLGQSFLSHIDNVSISGDEMVLNARD